MEEAPKEVIRIALKSANLIGDGLYGVDVKQVDGRCYVIEVNDILTFDAGNEDSVLKDALYREVMSMFLKRIEARKKVMCDNAIRQLHGRAIQTTRAGTLRLLRELLHFPSR